MVSLQASTPPGDDPAALSRRESILGLLQPFALDVCQNWRQVSDLGSVPLHEAALDRLCELDVAERIVMLSAPRAGHGKTHLLGRLADRLEDVATIAAMSWQGRDDVTWLGCGRAVLADLAAGSGQINALRIACAGVLATLLRRLIQTGRIPSTDPAQALRVLAQEPMELFTEAGNARVIGDWFRRHFDQLRRPLAEISNVDDPDGVESWLRRFFDYVEKPGPATLAALSEKLERNSFVQVSRFFRLLTVWRPLVLVADHMDGLHRDSEAGVTVARMALALAALPGVHVVLSVNQDLWESTFGRQLPSALEDRLSARTIALRGLTEADAHALITMRLEEAGVEAADQRAFLQFLDVDRFFLGRPLGSVSARTLLRHVSHLWKHWVQSDTATTDAVAASSRGRPSEDADAKGARPSEPSPQEAEGLQQLAESLAADAGGKVVHLSGAIPPPVAAAPPPDVIKVLPSPQATAPQPVASAAFIEKQGAELAALPHEGLPSAVATSSASAHTPRQPILTEVPPTTFHKLRQMLAKLKVATDSVPLAEAGLSEQEAASGGSNGHAPSALTESSLQARYEKFRHEIASTPRPGRVELLVLNDLIRLAGKRFPVVNYDEVELPGLLGRSLPRWTISGMEIVFGLEDFADTRYWKTASSYMAGRVAEIHAAAPQGNGNAPHLKLVVFKGDQEAAGLVSLLRDETIPPALRSIVDAVHLDPRSLASLYAMHQIIRETETGALQADTSVVLSTLANELDFFWKRVTRPKA